MKRLFVLALAAMLFLGVFSAPALADGGTVKVWTQNLYLGADLTPVVAATTEDEFYAAATAALEQMGANLFPLRAQRLATEVALNEPDLIALQEVEDITVNNANAGPPFVDHLQTLLDALALRGQHYEVAAIVVNLDLEVPLTFDITGDSVPDTVRVVDRDVILVRQGVAFHVLDFGCNRPSMNGCNYNTLAEVVSPAGQIAIERGFVGVDATVRGKRVFFVNTHLEERELVPGHPDTAGYQSAQAAELAGTLALLPSGVPLILVGDFNSSPMDMPIGSIIPPYQILGGYGFADSWKKNPLALLDPNGYTCCQDADLENKKSLLSERIDLILIRNARFLPWAFVTTRVPIIPLWLNPHWASDHGGVFAKLTFK